MLVALQMANPAGSAHSAEPFSKKISPVIAHWPSLHQNEQLMVREIPRNKGLPISMIVPPAEIFLQPKVENDKEVAAAHFPNYQFCNAVAAISPREGMTANE